MFLFYFKVASSMDVIPFLAICHICELLYYDSCSYLSILFQYFIWVLSLSRTLRKRANVTSRTESGNDSPSIILGRFYRVAVMNQQAVKVDAASVHTASTIVWRILLPEKLRHSSSSPVYSWIFDCATSYGELAHSRIESKPMRITRIIFKACMFSP